jgi:hypothetical protein
MTTTNKGFDQPAYNSNVNTWGTGPLNSNFGLIDIAFGGSTLLNATGLGGTTVALTQTQCRPASLVVSGSPGGIVTYTVPAGVGGQWIVRNGVADGYAIRIQSVSGGTYVSISAGDNLEVSCDGSASGMVRNTTAVTNAAGSNTQIQYNNAGAMAGSANLTFDGTTLSITGLNNSGSTVLGDAAGDALTINSNAMSIPNTLNIGSNTLYLSPSGAQVGIGTTTVGSNKLTVAGTVASTAGGFVFPDATVQTTAAATPPAIPNYMSRIVTFTANGTYTPVANIVCAVIECVGGGGAGGAAASVQGNGMTGGGGGGAGGYSRKIASAASIGASQTVTIGAGGTGGGGTGGNGTATSLGTLCIANGGSGGIYSQNVVAGGFNSIGQGGAGGTAGTGDIAAPGAPGTNGTCEDNDRVAMAWGGTGGSTMYGAGGVGVTTFNSALNGYAGSGYGAGGGGGSASSTGSSAGGNGTGGIVVVTEFYKL